VIGATADLRVVGPAYAEGAAVGNARSTTKVVKISSKWVGLLTQKWVN